MISASGKEAFFISIIPAMRKQGAPLCLKNFVKAIFQTKKKSKLFFITLHCGKSAAPHHLASQGASPRGEAAKRLTIFSRQGEAAKRLTIFAEENEGTEFSAGKGKMRSG